MHRLRPDHGCLGLWSGLLTSLSLSAIYNLWQISPAKSVLRRLDHAAIYLLIACTYTPFLTHLTDPVGPTCWSSSG